MLLITTYGKVTTLTLLEFSFCLGIPMIFCLDLLNKQGWLVRWTQGCQRNIGCIDQKGNYIERINWIFSKSDKKATFYP